VSPLSCVNLTYGFRNPSLSVCMSNMSTEEVSFIALDRVKRMWASGKFPQNKELYPRKKKNHCLARDRIANARSSAFVIMGSSERFIRTAGIVRSFFTPTPSTTSPLLASAPLDLGFRVTRTLLYKCYYIIYPACSLVISNKPPPLHL